jgi:type II secretory pathway pseudopilin PulG
VLVVLVLLGLAATVVAPAWRMPAAAPGAARADMFANARRVATHRGEGVRLLLGADGAWTVRATADTSGAVLLAGPADASRAIGISEAYLISPIGWCVPDGAAPAGTAAWDPVRCQPARR